MEHSHHQHHTDSPEHGHEGHNHHKMMIADFKKRFWVSLVVSIPVLILSPMMQSFRVFLQSFQI